MSFSNFFKNSHHGAQFVVFASLSHSCMFLWIMCMLFFVFCEKSVEEENMVAVADHGATSAAVSARHDGDGGMVPSGHL
jgi:hypothetical protein